MPVMMICTHFRVVVFTAATSIISCFSINYKPRMIWHHGTGLHRMHMPEYWSLLDECVCVTVVRLSEPHAVKYGLCLNMDERYRGLKRQLSGLCAVPVSQLLLVDVYGTLVRVSLSLCLSVCLSLSLSLSVWVCVCFSHSHSLTHSVLSTFYFH